MHIVSPGRSEKLKRTLVGHPILSGDPRRAKLALISGYAYAAWIEVVADGAVAQVHVPYLPLRAPRTTYAQVQLRALLLLAVRNVQAFVSRRLWRGNPSRISAQLDRSPCGRRDPPLLNITTSSGTRIRKLPFPFRETSDRVTFIRPLQIANHGSSDDNRGWSY